jgi:hypothetical protein
MDFGTGQQVDGYDEVPDGIDGVLGLTFAPIAMLRSAFFILPLGYVGAFVSDGQFDLQERQLRCGQSSRSCS